MWLSLKVKVHGSPFLLGSCLCEVVFLFSGSRVSFTNGDWLYGCRMHLATCNRKPSSNWIKKMRQCMNSRNEKFRGKVSLRTGWPSSSAIPGRIQILSVSQLALLLAVRWVPPIYKIAARRKGDFLLFIQFNGKEKNNLSPTMEWSFSLEFNWAVLGHIPIPAPTMVVTKP